MEPLPQDFFQPLKHTPDLEEFYATNSTSSRQSTWSRMRKKKLLMAAFFILLIILMLVIAVPWMSPFQYSDQILDLKNMPPGYRFYALFQLDGTGDLILIDHSPLPITPQEGFVVEQRVFWLGSDALGRDLFTRIWYGAGISLAIGVGTALIIMVIGTIYGGISGLFGGWVDEVMMRIVDILSTVPFLLYVILLMVLMEPGLPAIFTAIGAVYWLPMARLVRGEVLTLKEREYVTAARSMGAGSMRILLRHLIPNILGSVIVFVTLSIPDAIFTEAWLSFLGLGVAAPIASWGVLINEGIGGIRSYPWQLFFPAALICLTMLIFHVIGDGLKDVFDPRRR